MTPRQTLRPTLRTTLRVCLALMALCVSDSAFAQDDLRGTNDETEIHAVDFRFVGNSTFTPDQLREQMVIHGPSFAHRMRKRFAFLPLVTPATPPVFNPVELQRDMARLRRFYVRNGFLKPSVDYPATQFSEKRNQLRVIVTIQEGRPLITQSRTIDLQADQLPQQHREDWRRMVDRLPLAPNSRYTEFERLQLESSLRSFLRDRTFAFAEVVSDVRVDSVGGLVSVSLSVQPGPSARIDSIVVEGDHTVRDHLILRELPFSVGDPFAADALVDGQRALFGLNLFRVALVDLPPQPPDSSVTVRIRVREAAPRYEEANVGFAREDGLLMGAEWRHRNLFRSARQLTVSGEWKSGLAARPSADRSAVREVTAGVSLLQPTILTRNLSVTVGTGLLWLDDPNQDTRYREGSVSASLLYEILPYRLATLQYSLARNQPLAGSGSLNDIGLFSRSVIQSSATLGWLNNYLNPRRGWILRPSVELAGLLLFSDVSYQKAGLDIVGYVPITRRSSVQLKFGIGRLKPTGTSTDQTNPDTEFQFDNIRFYGGGANDVRGWGLNALGPRAAIADSVFTDANGSATTSGARFEPVGGLGKFNASVEIWAPISFLGPSWRAATFLDVGGMGTRLARDTEGRALFDSNGQPEINDRGLPAATDLRFGTGIGLRLQTPVGSVRFDLAFKLNPKEADLWSANQTALFDAGLRSERPDAPFRRRFNFHLSIDRAF